MAGKLTALFLAILIANPFCCCLAGTGSKAPAPSEHACCHMADQAPVPPDSTDPDPCDCPEGKGDREIVVTPDQPAAPEWILLAEAVWRTVTGHEIPGMTGFKGAVRSQAEVRPSGKVLMQVHCRYLL